MLIALLTLALITLGWSQEPSEFLVQTTHEIVLESGPLTYVATVGSLPIKDSSGKLLGQIFYTSYHKTGVEDYATRPITFSFNGGPGSSSVWLHLGAFGPKRILNAEEGQKKCPPYHLIENRDSLLDLTDLVFIDPIGTGFSRYTERTNAFYNTDGDISSIGDFIRDYITKENRWTSPKYLAGESYGTFRACGLSEYLLSKHNCYLNGVILISCALDFQTLFLGDNNELSYITLLPSCAATAWYHGRLNPESTLEEVVEEARRFALDSFGTTLWKEGRIPVDLYPALSYWTGLPLGCIEEREGLIDLVTYSLELLKKEKKVLGLYDSRWLEILPPPALSEYYAQLSWTPFSGLFKACFQSYLHNELNCKMDWPPYELVAEEPHRNWNYQSFGYPNSMDSLRKSLLLNPDLSVFVASGYFDLVTPFAGTEYCFKRLPSSLKEKVTLHYYEGGHMFYTNPTALKKFKEDLIKFFNTDLSSRS